MEFFNLAKFDEKFGEFAFAVDILAVSGGVLTNHDKLGNAAFGKFFRLFYDVLNLAASESAADFGDCAIGTAVVTAVGNFKIGGEGIAAENSVTVKV